jgi:hypothetical protein
MCCGLSLGGGGALAAGPPPPAASAGDKKLAQGKYDGAVKAFKARHFKEALAGFRASFDIVASPATRLMIGKSLKELGDVLGAYDEIDRAEAEARELSTTEERYASVAETAGKELEQLRPRVALVNVKIKGADAFQTLTLGGRDIPAPKAGRAVAVLPGTVEVVGTVANGHRVARQVAATTGNSVDLELDFSGAAAAPIAAQEPTPVTPPMAVTSPPDDAKPAQSSLLPYAAVAGGIGLVGFGVFAIFGVLDNKKHDDLTSSCSPTCSQDDIDAGKRLQLVANVGAVVGGVGVATAATLFIIDRTRSQPSSRSARVSFGVGPAALDVRGRF